MLTIAQLEIARAKAHADWLSAKKSEKKAAQLRLDAACKELTAAKRAAIQIDAPVDLDAIIESYETRREEVKQINQVARKSYGEWNDESQSYHNWQD